MINDSELRVGTAEVDITPRIGTTMSDGRRWRLGSGTHDSLSATAMTIERGETRFALCSCEVSYLSADSVDEVRASAAERSGLSGDSIVVATTHTHSGPVTVPRTYPTPPIESYEVSLIESASEAVVTAWENRHPAAIGVGTTEEHTVSLNRRAAWRAQRDPENRDDLLHTLEKEQRPSPQDVDGNRVPEEREKVDPEVGVLFVDGDHGEDMPVASLVNFACHPTTATTTKWSADYPGVLADNLHETFGGAHHTLFANGACGDIKGDDPPAGMDIDDVDPGFEKTTYVGERVADDVVSLYPDIRTRSEPTVEWTSETLTLPRRQPSAEHVSAAKDLLEQYSGSDEKKSMWSAFETVELANGPETHDVEIWAARIGDAGVVALPGEMFHEFGLDIKHRSPFKNTLLIELANGYCGYVPTREAFARGGYEIILATSSFLTPDAGYEMVETADNLLASLAT